MKAIGFGDPVETVDSDGSLKSTLHLMTGTDANSTNVKLSNDLHHMLETRRFEIEQELIAMDGAPSVAAVIRDMRSKNSASDIRDGLETALSLISNVLTHPTNIRVYRVKRSNPHFHRTLGRLECSHLLMQAIGFLPSPNTDVTLSSDNFGNISGIYFLKVTEGSSFDVKTALFSETGSLSNCQIYIFI